MRARGDGHLLRGLWFLSTVLVWGFGVVGSNRVEAQCGNGIVDGGEGCDDANTEGNDGCDAACAIEPGYICTSAIEGFAGSTCCQSAFNALFTFGGDAVYLSSTGEYRLTQNVTDEMGYIWFEERLDLNFDFTFDALVFFGSADGGADGLSMTFHRDSAELAAVGDSGYGLASAGLTPAIGAEFDTYQNTGCSLPLNDPASDHVAIWRSRIGGWTDTCGLMTRDWLEPVLQTNGTTSQTAVGNLEDGTYRRIRLEWVAATGILRAYLSHNRTESGLVLQAEVDGDGDGVGSSELLSEVFGDDIDDILFGLTASTGGSTNLQKFCPLTIRIPENRDGDGFESADDEDDDNDGIADSVELAGHGWGGDANSNFFPDYREEALLAAAGLTCTDSSPDDGICEAWPTALDADLDGTPNHLDVDSDADTVFDLVEGCDLNNGLFDSEEIDADYAAPVDTTPPDGIIDAITDTNGNGLDDRFDAMASLAGTPPSLPDFDENDEPNYLALDDDGDGIPTATEIEHGGALGDMDPDDDGFVSYLDVDSDEDELDDEVECSALPCPDTDTDDIPDYLDPAEVEPDAGAPPEDAGSHEDAGEAVPAMDASGDAVDAGDPPTGEVGVFGSGFCEVSEAGNGLGVLFLLLGMIFGPRLLRRKSE